MNKTSSRRPPVLWKLSVKLKVHGTRGRNADGIGLRGGAFSTIKAAVFSSVCGEVGLEFPRSGLLRQQQGCPLPNRFCESPRKSTLLKPWTFIWGNLVQLGAACQDEGLGVMAVVDRKIGEFPSRQWLRRKQPACWRSGLPHSRSGLWRRQASRFP